MDQTGECSYSWKISGEMLIIILAHHSHFQLHNVKHIFKIH